ncbi:MAG: response regulator [Candidatus Anammoxibacter sp.]
MSNTINITKFPKLDHLFKKSFEMLNVSWSRLLGKTIELEVTGTEVVKSGKIISKISDSKVLMEHTITLSGKNLERFHLMFFFQDIIIICGTALKLSENKIRDMFTLASMNGEFTNMFTKFSNQTSESFNNIFSDQLGEDITSIDYHRYFISPRDNNKLKETFPVTGEQMVLMIGLQFSLPIFGKLNFDLIFPLELVEGFHGETMYYSKTRKGGRILVVDDSKADIAIIRKHLRHKNYMIFEGYDEQSALYQIFSERVDLILIDIYLEDENGITICRKIRRNMLCDSIPIIMFSWGSTKDNIVKSLRSGAQDFMAKPFDKDTLLNKIVRFMPGNKNDKEFINGTLSENWSPFMNK